MNTYEKLLLENKAWAQEMQEEDPEFFKRLSSLQTPEFYGLAAATAVYRPIKLQEHSPVKYLCTATLPIW
jgi:hypothetical protein